MSITQRLALGFALLTVVMLGFAMQVHMSVAEVRDEFRQYHTTSSTRLELARTFERNVLYAAVSIRSFLSFPTDAYRVRMEDAFVATHQSLEALEAADIRPGAAALGDAEGLRAALNNYIDLARSLVDAVLTGAGRGDLEQRLSLSREQLLGRSAQIGDKLEQEARDHLYAVERDLREMVRLVGMTAVFSVTLFALLGFLLARSIRRPIGRMVEAARRWQAGDHHQTLALAADHASHGQRYSSELGLLITTLGQAAEAVRQREQRLAVDTLLCRQMMSSLEAEQLGKALLQEIVTHLGAAGAVVYQWHDESDKLLPLAGHRLMPTQDVLAVDEGLPGAAARSGEIVVLNDLPAGEQLSIKLGYDLLHPSHAAAVPVHFGNVLLGVMVVVQMRPFDAKDRDFLSSAANLLALGLRNSNAHRRLSILLDDLRASHSAVQRANEELQAQNEEIQAQHEELQAQNEEIQSQNEEIQAQHHELEEQNRRLAELSEHLRRHADEIEAGDQRKTEFLATLAHELRNPMAPISTSVSLLRRSCPGDERTVLALSTIERQSNHLIRLIEDLLDITRISRGKIELKLLPVDLVPLITDCIDDHRTAIESKRLSLTLNNPGPGLFVQADPDRIVQVIGNLLHNAIKFTPEDGSIRVSIEQSETLATVVVVDSGCGMSDDLIATLFQPFAQGPGGLDRKHGGLGLGLALARGLIEQHGGNITASSNGPGRGSRFQFTLPRYQPPKDQTPIPSSAPDRSRNGQSIERILIVDDNIDAANMLRLALEWDGYEVQMTHDGLSVSDLADSFHPHVVLCDIGLPGIDGYEVARRLRASPLHREIPLVAITGYASGSDRELSRKAGFNQHLAKPVDIATLSDLLRALSGGDRREPGGKTDENGR